MRKEQGIVIGKYSNQSLDFTAGKVLGHSSARNKRVQKNVNYIIRRIQKSAEVSYKMFVIFQCIYKKEFPMNSNNWLHNQTYITNVI